MTDSIGSSPTGVNACCNKSGWYCIRCRSVHDKKPNTCNMPLLEDSFSPQLLCDVIRDNYDVEVTLSEAKMVINGSHPTSLDDIKDELNMQDENYWNSYRLIDLILMYHTVTIKVPNGICEGTSFRHL